MMPKASATTLPAHGSLQRRMMMALVVGAAVLAVFLFLIVRAYATKIAQDGQDNILRASVSSVLNTALLRDGRIELDFPYSSFSMLDTELDDRVFYAIHQDGKLISGYDTLPAPDALQDAAPVFQTVAFEDTTVRLARATRTLIGAQSKTQVAVSIAQTQDALSRTLSTISRTVALFCLGFFVLVALLSYWATATTISPLMRLTASVKKRGPQDLSPFQSEVPSEMVPLVTSLNTLMGRLDQSLTQSEDFIAEAAHRVRTPLATVRSYAEATLQRVSKKENRNALRAMMRAIDESSRAASQLLDHAMITFRADHLQREHINLGDLVEDLATRMAPIAEMKDVVLDLKCDPQVTIKGDQILVQNAVRNLIDNALKYSPSDATIRIGVAGTPAPHVQICDQGPGFPPDDIDGLTKRFSRGKNADGTIGSGLGLTIAKDVAVAHEGALKLSNHSKGGACVILSF